MIIEINVQTGERSDRELTQEEIDALPKNLPNPRIAEIQSELAQLDMKLIRPLSEGEADRVAELVAQKAALRAELASL